MKIGYDHPDVKYVQDIIKKNNANIITLRKKFKLPSIEDPQIKEIEEMPKIIIEKNIQIKKMEEKI